MKRTLAPALLALLGAASCGSEQPELIGVTRAFAASVLGTAPDPPQITRALLDQVLTPVMLVTVENRMQQALVAELQTNGGVQTWSSVDDVTLSLRKGMIVATRGFGADLMAADVPGIPLGITGTTTHRRVHTLLNDEDQAVRTVFACTFQWPEPETITVVEITYHVTRISESCAAGQVAFQNEYWLSKDRHLRKSRQWISPDVGFLTVEDVRR